MKLKRIFKTLLHIFEGYITWIINKITGFTKPEYKQRLQICQECQHNKHGICELCGCIIKAKVRVDFILDEEGKSIDGCPERKW